MRLSEQEREANRAAFRSMTLGQKADYIVTYYKLPLVLSLIVVVALGSVAHKVLTSREPVLFAAYSNVVPPAEVDEALTDGFVRFLGRDAGNAEVTCYRELYLSADATTANHQYAYASRIKVMAAVEGQQLDVVLMNEESYDLLSASGYLLDLSERFAGDPLLQTNTVVLQSNQVEVDLGEAEEYEAETIRQANALEVTDSPLLDGFSGDERIFLGVVANTSREQTALQYLSYVSAGQ